MEGQYSVLTPLGYQLSSCGYCKGANSSPSYYCHGYKAMRPSDYEALVNRMWRRSGSTYYKPDSKNSCCPHYTIRLDAANFQVSKQQKKTQNKFNSYIIGEDYRRKAARVFPKSKEEKKRRKGLFDVCDRVHEAEWMNLRKQDAEIKLEAIRPAHKLEVGLEPDSYTEEKYLLFEQYQRLVHKEPPTKISRSGFKSFLCSGLRRSTFADDGKTRPIGSYHQCYRIDGRLVAIGFLDLLPHCVSSVYLIYDLEFSSWEFGKLSALREIAMVKELNYRYYYMGYYIHSCTKMRYKRSFKPTYVLDPESYDWNLFDVHLLARLDNRKYVSLSREQRDGIKVEDKELASPTSTSRTSDSLFSSGMPGIHSTTEIASAISLPDLPFLYRNKIMSMSNIPWSQTEMRNEYTIQGRLAEFIACIGNENLFMVPGNGGKLLAALEMMQEEEEEEEDEDDHENNDDNVD